MKLQDAYVSEKGTTVGSWKQIGYLMKNSNNFYYCGAETCSASTNTDGYGSSTDITTDTYVLANGWRAQNVSTLNDCQANSFWNLATSANSTTGGSILYEATTTGTDCEALTPNFKLLKTKSDS